MKDDALKDFKKRMEAKYKKGEVLLQNIKKNLSSLEELLDTVRNAEEDRIYRFYHYSFKVYWLQELTDDIVEILMDISPHEEEDEEVLYGEFNKFFTKIVNDGTNKTWVREHNDRWLEETRPIVEAFFHAKYFLEMAVKYGHELDEAPNLLPSGWAALLELYNIR